MRKLIADGVKVQMCVTSPPYFGLRDYGVDGQLGLEQTPEQYIANMVEVFRLVRELLADDGTAWINIGDSYAANRGYQVPSTLMNGQNTNEAQAAGGRPQKAAAYGLKPKDLIGIPWALAKALRDPYYSGQIKQEMDRVWLAAIVDGEGCFFIHKRKAGTSAHSNYTRADGTEANYSRTADTYGVGLEICNTNKAIIDRVQEIVGTGTITTQSPQQNNRRKQTIYRWRVAPNEAKRLAQELYPHLVGKQHQARLIYNCPSSGEGGASAHRAMMDLHNGIEASAVDYPPPPSLFEPGWYLRQDVIWSKKNCMPESVTDRCTKSHEYIFLLSKSQHYYFDHKAIKEPLAQSSLSRLNQDLEQQVGSNRVPGKTNGNMKAVGSMENRNKRSVWEVATQPYSGAHFATFPPALIEPCILAGSRPGDIVLDPFMGSGTTAQVSQSLGRNWIGCELNPAYEKLQKKRTEQLGLVLA